MIPADRYSHGDELSRHEHFPRAVMHWDLERWGSDGRPHTYCAAFIVCEGSHSFKSFTLHDRTPTLWWNLDAARLHIEAELARAAFRELYRQYAGPRPLPKEPRP